MINAKNVVVTLIVGAILIVGGFWVFGSSNVPQEPTKVGSLAGPDIPSQYISWGGVPQWAFRNENLYAATTTVCSFQSPAATSTLMDGSGIRFAVSSTTATVVGIYKAAFQTGNTTLLYQGTIGANAQATIVATSTNDNFVFAPNAWFNVIMSGGTGTFSPSGTCEVNFVAI